MLYTIENDVLKAQVTDLGGELLSLVRKDNGVEYVWQGDPTFWAGHAPNLFPICGRLWEGKYTYQGKTYEMLLHGFTRKMPMTLVEQKADSVTFVIRADEETRKIYPFDFAYFVTQAVVGDTLRTTYTAENHGDNVMPFAFGGHPGFPIPLGGEGKFEEYFVTFEKDAAPRVLDMKECFMTDDTTSFPVDENRRYHLHHDMFHNDAIFLCDAGHTVTLASDKGERSLTVSFPDMDYVGLWHAPDTEAPYMCIEPWMSVPAYHGKIDDMEQKRDMTRLAKGESYTTHIDITVR